MSYQFNPVIIDSSLVIESNDITLLNSNDSRTFGLSLKQIINNHPPIDFAFRSHSSATPIRHCIRDLNVELTDRTPSDYADDFIAFAKATKSKYAITFASSHIYLHHLTKKYNRYYSDPSFIKKQFDLKINSKQKCQIMVTGSSWSKEKGFEIKNHNFKNLESDIEKYSIKNNNKLQKQKATEERQILNQKAFGNYYFNFLKACSFPINILNFKFGFLIDEKKALQNFHALLMEIRKKQ